MRTRIYIDGYNLYYGCLKRTSFKWLDLFSLFSQQIFPSISLSGRPLNLTLDTVAIKFFTAEILEQAAQANDSRKCQEQYHSALRKHTPERVQIINGYYALTTTRAKAIDLKSPKKWPRECADVEVWKLEEKQTDVNLAIHALKDSLCGEVEHIVIVTNDTDIAPAISMIRELTTVVVGLVVPTRDHERPPNHALSQYAHWIRSHITAAELQASQFPRVVGQGKRIAIKPLSWYANSHILLRALELGSAELGNRSKAFRWLNAPNQHYGNRTPLSLIEAGDGAKVISFMENWSLNRTPAA